MFTQPCFIKKETKELREKLNCLGYELIKQAIYYHGLFCIKGNYWQVDHPFDVDTCDGKGYKGSCIDCGTNEELFLAIAALRDDTNMHQWFIWDSKEDQNDNIGKWRLYDDNYNWSWRIFECHKATVEELIEHFNNKE